jgi:6-pyruvoyltetrahydropterin/6-carboxytetrahydropterin synthase
MAHALLGYDGLCKNIHGHSYTLIVTVKGKPIKDENSPKNGMLIDFGDLKKLIKENIINEYDHALVLNEKSPATLIEELKKHFDKVVLTPYQPTTENMLEDLATRISKLLPAHLSLVRLLLRETETSFAEWYAGDNR